MAIDTESRRRSVSGYTGLIIAPLADSTVGAADWEHMAGLYAGIQADEPYVPPPPTRDAGWNQGFGGGFGGGF